MIMTNPSVTPLSAGVTLNRNGTEATPRNDVAGLKENSIEVARREIIDLIHNPTSPERQDVGAGILTTKTANKWTEEAAARPNPIPLWLSLWHEGEVCCLFADSNLGKSIYAVEIATEIAKNQKVIYFDFELSDKQFQLRYTDDFGDCHLFPDNLLRSEINPELITGGESFEEMVISAIEEAALTHKAKVLIIDNLSFLCNNGEKGDAAGLLMMRLIQLKKEHGLSLLILAHTPKRSMNSPITQNDLAGSKKLFNFFDSCFAMGMSAKDSGLRYIKQLKSRNGAIVYGGDNVIVCEIVKDVGFLHFKIIGYSSETDHLKEKNDRENVELIEETKRLKEEGKSQRHIADSLGISLGKVNKILKNL